MSREQWLRVCSIGGAFLVGFWIPIRLVGFIPPIGLEVLFDALISFISGINIYLYFRDTGLNPKKLAHWMHLGLLLDVVCLLPLSFFAFVMFGDTAGWILVLNLLSARHIRAIKPFLDNFDSLQPITYRLVPLVLTLPLLVHLIACSWIALGSGTAGPDPDQLLQYVKAVYWTFTTLTTVGYGDISAKTIPQMLFACGVQIVGVGVFGFILSNVASLLSRSDAAREHHMDNLDRVETFMRMNRIPPHLRGKIRAYYHYMWQSRKGYEDETLLEGLPGKIQSELNLHINQSMVEKVPFLQQASHELIEDLMNELEARVFVPDERIFRIDEDGDALYFVHNGEVEILDRNNQPIVQLGDGAFFGEMALISDKPRSATAKSRTFCHAHVLKKEAFRRVTTKYPEFKRHLENLMKERRAA